MVLQDLFGESSLDAVLDGQRDPGNGEMLRSRNLAKGVEEETIDCNADCTDDTLRKR